MSTEPARFVLAVGLALIPEVTAWWSGRRLLRRREEDPAFVERLDHWRSRIGLAGLVYGFVAVLVGVGRWEVLVVALVFAGELAGGYQVGPDSPLLRAGAGGAGTCTRCG